MDHDQLFKSVLTAQLAPFMELFFPDEAAQLDLTQARFVDKEIFAAPPVGPSRELDLLADVPLRTPPTTKDNEPGHALVAIHIEIQAQREPEFIWRELEYYALQRRVRGIPVFPIALFPMVDVLGRERGRRPQGGFERVLQRDDVLGHRILEFEFLAVTLRALDASIYLARPQALAGALAARMRPTPRTPLSQHKVACLHRIIGGTGMDREETQRLLVDVVETYLPLTGADAKEFEALLQLPENEGIRETMKTWSEQQQEIGEERGKEIGK
ncbi:MAG TPA: hypothetical protein VGN32_22020, partial [Ktedonobacterales bacterium]|nr:hypothetical protein [Ktedonobacterales bacterium]